MSEMTVQVLCYIIFSLCVLISAGCIVWDILTVRSYEIPWRETLLILAVWIATCYLPPIRVDVALRPAEQVQGEVHDD